MLFVIYTTSCEQPHFPARTPAPLLLPPCSAPFLPHLSAEGGCLAPWLLSTAAAATNTHDFIWAHEDSSSGQQLGSAPSSSPLRLFYTLAHTVPSTWNILITSSTGKLLFMRQGSLLWRNIFGPLATAATSFYSLHLLGVGCSRHWDTEDLQTCGEESYRELPLVKAVREGFPKEEAFKLMIRMST